MVKSYYARTGFKEQARAAAEEIAAFDRRLVRVEIRNLG